MKRLFALVVAAAASLAAISLAGALHAGQIGFEEDFALAKDRAAVLGQLIPGTEEYYLYNCLQLQNTGQLDKVDELLKLWVQRYNRTPGVIEMENRQALLRYDTDPAGSLKFIQTRLDLKFNQQREILGQKPQLPTSLNASLITRDVYVQQALRLHPRTVDGFEDSGLWLGWQAKSANEGDLRRSMLQRVRRPDFPNVVQLIVDDLNYRYSGGFGSMPIHAELLRSQLDDLLRLKPDLLNQTSFVNACLSKLGPNPDIDWTHDAAERTAYYDRVWAFVSTLAPAHNSLKACVLYNRLAFDRSQGVWDKARFMEYIKLPRSVDYINKDLLLRGQREGGVANLRQSFKPGELLPPIVKDDPLVRSYLAHFFVAGDTAAAYEPYINDVYLKRLYAETMIVNGVGDMEKWYSMLPPVDYQRLKDRVDLDFVETNKTVFAPNDPVSLELYVKNVPKLIVKVFEINTANFYRDRGAEINTDINLDGLVANREDVYTYTEPPLRRVLRKFPFDNLSARGVYIVEFIGNGQSSRALIRKGELHQIQRMSSAGHIFTVLDESNHKLPAASLWMAGKEYKPDADGTITVPFSTKPGEQKIVLRLGDFASLSSFMHESEDYVLDAGFYVDRESLLKRKKTAVVIRPQLNVNGFPVSLSLLEEVKLTITSVDADGIETTREVPEFKLYSDRESTCEFQVPENVATVEFELTAKVQNLSANDKEDVFAGQSFDLNGIDATNHTEDLHLRHVAGVYFIDVLGKTGEPQADRPVAFAFKHLEFKDPVDVSVQSQRDGAIALGELKDIEWLRATGPAGVQHTWHLIKDEHTYPSRMDAAEGDVVSVPYMGKSATPLPSEISLLETRDGTCIRNAFDAVSVGGGFITLKGLARGDYELTLKSSGDIIDLHVAKGEKALGYVMGESRNLEITNPAPLQIAAVEVQPDTVRIRLANASKFARVHVVATRFMPQYPLLAYLDDTISYPDPCFVPVEKPESLYIAGRNIGDEYRYILDRKYATRYPGNMLTRPSMLLNPWAIRKTETGKEEASEGTSWQASGGRLTGKGQGGGGGSREQAAKPAVPEMTSNLDFLAEPSAAIVNLRPDAAGVVTIARKDLGPHSQLHVLAVDPFNTAYREITLPDVAGGINYLDLRLQHAFDPAKHFTEQKEVTVLKAGEKLTVADVSTSKLEAYDSVAKLYSLFETLGHNASLTEFRFILDWPKLKDAEKQEKYSKYACHELNYFLYRKDPAFFNSVVLPYLKNKKDKTFLDDYLIGADLSGYMKPWNYSRLNIVERSLLAERIGGERDATARAVNDLYDLIPPDVERVNHLFDTALKGSALEAAPRGSGQSIFASDDRLASVVPAASMPGNAAGRSVATGTAGSWSMAKAVVTREHLDAKADVGTTALADMARAERPEPGYNELSESVDHDADMTKRKAARQLYRALDKTEEWVENNYYHLPIEVQNDGLVTVNALWRDFARMENPAGFISSSVAEGSRNFTEMMFALSSTALPFEAAKHAVDDKDLSRTITPGSAMIVYHKEIKEAQASAEKTPILVSQNFFRASDRYTFVNNERIDKYVTDEFLVGVVYGCQVVLTNPTSSQQKLDLLLQVPEGAMPVQKGFYTRGVHVELASYNTTTVEYYFYFPAPGKFQHYPVHVAKNEKLIAFAPAVTLNVVVEPTRVDTTSWDYISQNGSDAEVLDFLKNRNVNRVDLARIAWRMKNADFFRSVTALLTSRHVYDQTLWSFSLMHNDLATLREYLQHCDGFVAQCGAWIDSKPLTIDPVIRRAYQHMEYSPLVNARAHRLGKHNVIVNDRFFEQYEQLMHVLAYRPKLDDDDMMAVAYYMLLQDRVDDARMFFVQVAPAKLATTIQYDYMNAYLDFYTDAHTLARPVAAKYAAYPVDRWRNAFAGVIAQLDEIEGKAPRVVDNKDRTQAQTQLAATEAGFDFKVESKQVTLTFQNVTDIRVNYYLMDIELLFSRNPFVQEYTGQFAYIRPNDTVDMKLPPGTDKSSFALPAKYFSQNVMVEIEAGGIKKSRAYFSNSLACQVIEAYGQVRVADEAGGKAIPKAYVKVYARMNDGRVEFYKDGYTDLRGRFDYATLSTSDIDNVQRFSILVMTDAYGAVVKEAAPPKR